MMASQYARLSYRWLVAIPFFGLSTLAIGLPLIVISLMGFGDLGSRTLAVLWAKLNSIVLRMQVTVEGHDNIKPQQILDQLTYANPALLSELITIILNANRYKSSRLGVRKTLTVKETVSRNIID